MQLYFMSWPKLRKCLWEAADVLHVDRTIIIKAINLYNANFVEFGIVFNAFVKEKGIIQEPKMPAHSCSIFVIVVMTNFWVFLSIMYKMVDSGLCLNQKFAGGTYPEGQKWERWVLSRSWEEGGKYKWYAWGHQKQKNKIINLEKR